MYYHFVACLAILLISDVSNLPVALSHPALVSPDRLKEGIFHFKGLVDSDDALMLVPVGVDSNIDQNQ